MSILNLYSTKNALSEKLEGNFEPSIISNNSANFSLDSSSIVYHRIGETVLMSGQFTVTTINPGPLDFTFDLPIEPDVIFSDNIQANGVCIFNGNVAGLQVAVGTKNLQLVIDSGITGLDRISFNGSYNISF